MQISQISFGKKVPKYDCKIQNKQTGKFEPATFYEVDCRDFEDAERLKNLDLSWQFSGDIAENMREKYIKENFLKQKVQLSFYIIENKNEEIVGISEVDNDDNIFDIAFIESMPLNKYKYVGQNMIAGIGKELLNKNGKMLTILAPLQDAVPFYKKLGFKTFGFFSMNMPNRDNIKSMIKNIEDRTQSSLIDINA